jgi:hypothetical protein
MKTSGMRISSWQNGGPSLARDDAAPSAGWYALYTQFNVGGCGHDDHAVVQIVLDNGETARQDEVSDFCRSGNYTLGAFSFTEAAWFEKDAALFPAEV